MKPADVGRVRGVELVDREQGIEHAEVTTAAPIDEGQLFYLKSRGVREADAIKILVNGFFEDALRALPEQLRPEIERAVAERLSERYSGGIS